MFEEKKKKLIIVCIPDTKVYAYQLLQLIGEKDDTETEIVGCKDGSVQAAIWEEKYYLHNEHTLSSDEKVVFIGNMKIVKSILPNIEEKYNKYGMKYGWLGNRSVIYVDKRFLTEDDYLSFYQYSVENGKRFEKLKEGELVVEKKSVGIDWIYKGEPVVEKLTFKDKFLSVSGKIQTGITSPAMKKKVREQQYNMATYHFYLYGLSHFLED